MKTILINNISHVISRERNGKIEIVSPEGNVSFLDEKNLLGIPISLVSNAVVPNVTPFASRPKSFLTELRIKRDVDLIKRQAKKRSERIKKDLLAPRVKRKSKKIILAEATASLPFDLAGIMKKGKV